MAYLPQDNKNVIENLLTRKEFYWNRRWPTPKSNKYADIIPRFLLDDAIIHNGNLKLASYQTFVANFNNPNTPYNRLLLKWQTGTGKTVGALSIAMNFINHYRLEREVGNVEIGSIFIIGFSERVFKNELLRFPEFGFLSRKERLYLDKLKRIAANNGSRHDVSRYQDFVTKIKKRFSNRKGNGFFRFFGYKAFVNRIFITSDELNINTLNEEQIRQALVQKKIKYNEELLAQFKNSLIICDEIHNVYNSAEKNNWGVAIQAVLDYETTCRAVFASATPLNNSPSEIVDLMNLLLPRDSRLRKSDFFTSDRNLKPGALQRIAELSRGRVSYLTDVNPKYYPSMKTHGTPIKSVDYLKFVRCPMSSFHYNTYRQVYTGTLSQDSQYLIDFALENPDPSSKLAIYQTSTVKNALTSAPISWKNKHGLDYRNGKIIGDALLYENIGKYSAKYKSVLEHVFDVIKKKRGKIFIYHNIVHMSGVLFIEQMLIKNGFADEFSSANDNTICFVCGKPRRAHTQREIYGSGSGSVGNISNSNDNVSPPDIYLEERNNNYDWIRGEFIMATFTRKADHYLVKAGSLDNDLVKGRSYALRDFSRIQEELDQIPILVEVPNYAPRFGEWLLQTGFKIQSHSKRFTLLKYDPVKSGGKKSRRNSKKPSKSKSRTTRKKTVRINRANRSVNRSKSRGKFDHKYQPARFIVAHSDIEKSQMEHSIDKFNNPDNVDGHRFMILVGSKIIKESYDLKGLQNIFITGRPDNIPTFLQIRGRGVRKNSHRGLPPENRVVHIYIFTSCLPVKERGEYKLSYEEIKYKEKIQSFKIMQRIEQTLHENAIDSVINYELINRPTAGELDPLRALPFKPNVPARHMRPLAPKEVITSTFNVYYAEQEVALIRVMIKRMFIEISPVWEYNDLFAIIQEDPLNYENEFNTRLFSKSNYSIALSQLVWNQAANTTYTEPLNRQASDSTMSIIDKLYDTNDKIITLPGGQDSIIVPSIDGNGANAKQFYILFPINIVNSEPDIDLELPYRLIKQEFKNIINMNSFVQNKKISFDYQEKLEVFYRKYIDIPIENMEQVICEYGSSFHVKFIEECIEYVFNIWTNPNIVKHKFHDFYFKMLYYYDLMSLVLWAYTAKPKVFRNYAKYAIPVKAKDIKLKTLDLYDARPQDVSPDDNSDLATSGVINLLKSSFNKTSNRWIPQEFRKEYNNLLENSHQLFIGRRKKSRSVTKVSAKLLPIGHYISKFPRLYSPDKNGWIEDPTYAQTNKRWKENSIIIGFEERSATGMHIRFKLRRPIQNIKTYRDKRLIHKGTVCSSLSKERLTSIAKKLDVVLPRKTNVVDLCSLIKSKLIRKELLERIADSSIKYYYFHYEMGRPDTRTN